MWESLSKANHVVIEGETTKPLRSLSLDSFGSYSAVPNGLGRVGSFSTPGQLLDRCIFYLRTILVHVGQVFGQGRQGNVFLQVPQCGWINLHPFNSVWLDPPNFAEQTLRLQTHHHDIITSEQKLRPLQTNQIAQRLSFHLCARWVFTCVYSASSK